MTQPELSNSQPHGAGVIGSSAWLGTDIQTTGDLVGWIIVIGVIVVAGCAVGWLI